MVFSSDSRLYWSSSSNLYEFDVLPVLLRNKLRKPLFTGLSYFSLNVPHTWDSCFWGNSNHGHQDQHNHWGRFIFNKQCQYDNTLNKPLVNLHLTLTLVDRLLYYSTTTQYAQSFEEDIHGPWYHWSYHFIPIRVVYLHMRVTWVSVACQDVMQGWNVSRTMAGAGRGIEREEAQHHGWLTCVKLRACPSKALLRLRLNTSAVNKNLAPTSRSPKVSFLWLVLVLCKENKIYNWIDALKPKQQPQMIVFFSFSFTFESWMNCHGLI